MATDWTEKSLADLINVKHGFAFKGEFFTEEETPEVLLTPGNFAIGGGFKFDKLKHYSGPIEDDYILSAGDLLVTMTDLSKQSDTLGYPAIVPESTRYRFHHNQRLGLVQIRDPKELDKIFLYYLLCSREYRAEIIAGATGTTVKHTSPTKIRAFTTKIPELCTQEKIGQILGTLDDKIQLNVRMNRTLETMAQAIFKSWFVDFEPVQAKAAAKAFAASPAAIERAAMAAIAGRSIEEAIAQAGYFDDLTPANRESLAQTAALFPDTFQASELGETPEGWTKSSFGAVSECLDSKRIPLSKREREKRKGQFPYYGATSIMDYVDDYIYDETLLLLGEDGSVVHEDGTPFTQYVWGKIWVNNHAHVLRGVDAISTEQLLLFIQQTDISSRVTGAVQLKLNQKNMNSIPFLKADNELHEAFQSLTAPLFQKIKNKTEETGTLSQLRDALLPKLLSGELAVPEAESQTEEVDV